MNMRDELIKTAREHRDYMVMPSIPDDQAVALETIDALMVEAYRILNQPDTTEWLERARAAGYGK